MDTSFVDTISYASFSLGLGSMAKLSVLQNDGLEKLQPVPALKCRQMREQTDEW